MKSQEREILMSAMTTPSSATVCPISCDEALTTARKDAEMVYRDLSGFRIIIERKADGWHIDYELSDVYLKGGGPHYVIDAMTGTIVSKRYEQ
jgi:uncharacterized membrane protein YkoI